MKKLQQIQKLLEDNNHFIQNNPDKLRLFIDEGTITASATECLGFEYQYTLNLSLSDYDQSMNNLMMPIISWMYLYQQEFMLNSDLRKKAIQFALTENSDNTKNVAIKLKLTERVIVKKTEADVEYRQVNDALPVEMRPEWLNQIWPTI